MGVLYIFAASDIECRPVLARIERKETAGPSREYVRGQVGSNTVVLFKTGMGPDAARKAAEQRLDFPNRVTSDKKLAQADAIIVTGFAGSLSDELKEGDIVVYSSCISGGDRAVSAISSAGFSSALLNALRKVCAPRTVTGISSTRMAVDPKEKEALALLGADAVDMESYEIISAANKASIPAVVVRAISDSKDRVLPDFNRALNAKGGFNAVRLAMICLGSPMATWRLFRASRKAGLALARALSAVLTVDISPVIAAESKVQPDRLGV